jgi:primosomal protein N' (replication factor Y)
MVMAQYVEALLPLYLPGTLTYHLPPTITVGVGSRVLVPLGRKKIYTAIVVMIHDRAPQGYDVKDVIAALDSAPIVRHPQLKFWEWIASYYMCSMGEVYKAALPSGLKVESETFISPNPEYEEDVAHQLSDRERVVLDFTSQRGRVQIAELTTATGFRSVEGIVSRLLDRGALLVSERVMDNYRPKTESFVRLTLARDDEAGMHALFDALSRARKQEQLLLAYLDLSHWLQRSAPLQEVGKEALLKRADVTAQVLKAMTDRGVMEVYKRQINRFAHLGEKLQDPPALSEEQERAHREIHLSFKDHNITLLHGVTSSGKTAIYMHLIAHTLSRGLQVLYLVPEIALTTQLTQRLRAVFGDKMLVYHSRFSDNERVDIYRRLLGSSEPCVVVGVRSSVFLPFAQLGLVIVDEEHDSSYKQQDPAPRYNGRNAAIMLAQMHGAKTLLGSATPAIEVYHRAVAGQYGLVKLLTRYGDIAMPEVKLIDTAEAWRQREMNGMFSRQLLSYSRHALENNEQVILFQNRRGYAPMVRCRQCGWVPKCENCDVSLTYHKHTHMLTCHYCGYTITLPQLCPACETPHIQVVGYGTERIEDEVDRYFPGEKISRMDLDTTRSKSSYDRIIDDFSHHRTNVLVGTQMVTKGLDFEAVSVVGILNADTMLHFPDFRASERAFDMLEQVAGRAGRAHKRGLVLVQTSDVEHPVLGFVLNHDYEGFYAHELAERERFVYPPFVRIINVYLRHREEAVVNEVAARLATLMRQVFGTRVLGPEPPLVSRVQNLYIRQLVLKIEPQASMSRVKAIMRQQYDQLLGIDARARQVRIHYDVDPV